MRPGHLARLAFALVFALAACGGHAGDQSAGACDDSGVLHAQAAGTTNVEVTLCGSVTRVRRERETRSGMHRYFYVRIAPGDDIEVIANVSVMGEFPVRVGDRAQVRGRFFHDPDGREGVDWTHHARPGSRWPAGYVTLNGVTYR